MIAPFFADEPAWSLRVYMNDGTGRFEQRAVLGLQGGRVSVTLADVDGDGVLDALATQDQPNLLTVWRTAGTGSIGTRVDIPTHRGPYAAAAADLNGDGHPEIVVSNATGAPLEVFDVKGFSGAPTVRKEVSVGHCYPTALALGNFDGDTDTDVGLSCQGLTILHNDGQANLTLAEHHPSGCPTHGLHAADIDKDGRLDLMLDDCAQGPTLFTGTGDGRFLSRASWASSFRNPELQHTLRPAALQVVDVNNDGKLDLLSRTNDPGNLALLLGDGGGSFRGPEAKLLEPRVESYAFGDINGDGAGDVISHNAVFLNEAQGAFRKVPSAFAGALQRETYVMDVNDDRRSDVITLTPNVVSIWLSDGSTLVASQTLEGVPKGALHKHDADHDGTPDLVFVRLFARGLGGGRFDTPRPLPTRAGIELWGAFHFADFNGDGELDIYTGNYATPACSGINCYYTARGNAVLLWDKATKRYERLDTVPSLRVQAVDDVTGDGLQDLIGEQQLARGKGDGTFAAPEPLPALSLVEQARLGLRKDVLVSDVDNDGRKDALLFRGGLPQWLDVMRGGENGELLPPVTVFAPGFHGGAQLVDVDDDGLPELVRPAQQGIAVLKLSTR